MGMKNQYHRKKRTTQVKLAQACKSWGMFLDSPSFRNPKDYMQIRLGNRQIFVTGVKPEGHLFVYGFTAPMDIDCHVDTLIGGQRIFAEEGKALEHDDNNAAMKTLQDEAILESESEEMSKYKSRVDLSQVQQQRGQRVFHKVRFKVKLRRSSKVTYEKVTKDGELFKLEKSELLHKGRKYTRKLIVRWYYYKVRKRVKPLGAVETGFKCLSKAGTEAGYKAKIIVSAVSVMLLETVEVRRSQV